MVKEKLTKTFLVNYILSMFRGNQQILAKYDTDKQKQKKKLSFREPEVEGHQLKDRCGNTSTKHFSEKTENYSAAEFAENRLRRHTASLEDLTLEDQALQIVKNVGQAFVQPGFANSNSAKSGFLLTTERVKKDAETRLQRGAHSSEDLVKIRGPQKKEPRTNPGFLDSLAPPLREAPGMRYPSVEDTLERRSPSKDLETESLEKLPTCGQHQIQLLKYQLEQQSQQTQIALHHVQLLKDQLEAESTARYKAQAQNYELMKQNQELLDHIQRLFQQIQDLEKQVEKYKNNPVGNSTAAAQEPQTTQNPAIERATAYRRYSSEALSLRPYSISTNSNYMLSGRRSSITTSKLNQSTSIDANKRQDDGQMKESEEMPIFQNKTSHPPEIDWRLKFQEQSSLFAPRSSFCLLRKPDGGLNIGDDVNKSQETNKNRNFSLSITNFDENTTSNAQQTSSTELNKHKENSYLKEKSLTIDEESESKIGNSAKHDTQAHNRENSTSKSKRIPYPQSNIRWHQHDKSTNNKTNDLKIS